MHLISMKGMNATFFDLVWWLGLHPESYKGLILTSI